MSYDEQRAYRKQLEASEAYQQQFEATLEAILAAYVEPAQVKARQHALQQVCPHPSTTWHPDPSGNNDSWTDCDVCGKDL